MKCDCRVLNGPHDDWCSSHPLNVARHEIEILEIKISKLEKVVEAAKKYREQDTGVEDLCGLDDALKALGFES